MGAEMLRFLLIMPRAITVAADRYTYRFSSLSTGS